MVTYRRLVPGSRKSQVYDASQLDEYLTKDFMNSPVSIDNYPNLYVMASQKFMKFNEQSLTMFNKFISARSELIES